MKVNSPLQVIALWFGAQIAKNTTPRENEPEALTALRKIGKEMDAKADAKEAEWWAKKAREEKEQS